jgi:hypothetical protein
MEQSPSWEANNFSASQEFPRVLWKPKFHHRDLNIPPLLQTLNQIYAVHAIPIRFIEYLF